MEQGRLLLLFFFVIHNLEGLHKNLTQYPETIKEKTD